jgi:lysophospholipase L1-like esterase
MKEAIKLRPRMLARVVLFFLGYSIWFLLEYQYYQLSAIRWHTHIVVYLLIGFIAAVFSSLLSAVLDKTVLNRVIVVFYASLTTLFILEILLLLGLFGYKTYSENNNGRYLSLYSNYMPGIHHTYWVNGLVNYQKAEYQYVKHSNTLGFIDHEWPEEKQDEEIRIMAMGDSFTEGDGAHFDSSYVAALRRILPDKYTLLNAGVCGSDPIYNYKILEEILVQYQPDHILQTISADDIISDFRIRGGFERYDEGDQKYFRSRPWWEPIYAVNHVSRILFSALGYDRSLQKSLTSEEEEKLKALTNEVIYKYSKLGQQNSFTISIILLPTIEELCYGMALFDVTFINKLVKQYPNITVVNLSECYLNRFNQNSDSLIPYFWPLDKHHNAAGYQMLAECIADNLKGQLLFH